MNNAITLASLMTDYTVTVRRFVPSATDAQTVAQANPQRWALIIVPTATIITDPSFQIVVAGCEPFSIERWNERMEVNNRDHPGLPQQQWVMSAAAGLTEYQVIEVIKQAW